MNSIRGFAYRNSNLTIHTIWCISMPPGQEKFVGIAELKGWGYSNSDVRGYLSALSILQVPFFVCVSIQTCYKTG